MAAGMEAAKRRSFWLVLIASALVLWAPTSGASHAVVDENTRAELAAKDGQSSVGSSLLSPETASGFARGQTRDSGFKPKT